MIAKILPDPFRKLAEGIDLWPNRSAKMADIVFIIVAPVQNDHIILLQLLVKFGRGEAFAADGVRVKLLLVTEGDQLFFMANEHFLKSMAFRFVDLEHDIGEQRVGSEVVHILLGLLHRTGQCSVDALGGDQDASLEAQLFAV
ncbi:hypothetical protein D3C81_1332420 [compost metagenome]